MAWMLDSAPTSDIGFVVRELNIKYKNPTFGDNFIVETCSTHIGAASLKIEQKVQKDNKFMLYYMLLLHIGADMKPKRIPEEYIKKIKEKQNAK